MLRRSSLVVLALGFASGCVRPGLHPVALPGAREESPSRAAGRSSASHVSADEAPLIAFDAEAEARIRRVDPWVDAAAAEHGIEPSLIRAIIWVESRFDPRARSQAGARGLMQLMPGTAATLARRMGRPHASSFDPEFNVAAGTLYLARLRTHYDGDLRLAIAAYNAGAGNVDAWIRGDGLPPRSEQYVARVLAAKARFDAWTPAPEDTRLARAAEIAPKTEPVARRPARVAAPPLVVFPDADVRFDLDRVESSYVPRPDPEPPLADTPYPHESRPGHAPEPTPRGRPSRDRASERSVESPRIGIGVLPSVLD